MFDWKRKLSDLSAFTALLGGAVPRALWRTTWDREYASGEWKQLHSEAELVRYRALVELIERSARGGALLDVGCGNGRLLELLAASVPFETFVGVDVSAEALRQAAALAVPNTRFIVSDAESFSSDRAFDAIVFNEVVYYLRDPVEVLRRYETMLRPGGTLIVSMFRCLPAAWVWRRIERSFDYVATRSVSSEAKIAWDLRILRRRGG